MRTFLRVALLIPGLFWTHDVPGADWPQYRYDAGRTAASPESLPAALHLQWVRQLSPPRPAFPGEMRLSFDASYEPVVLGGTMFIPSMITDSITALDVETGTECWHFFTEGPVRFSPVLWEGNVYFVSDDGYLYCLDAAHGNLRWKFRSLPPGKSDRKLLGSGRLISLFPARGGPVLKDGVIYFGAGIWSGYGVAIHAMDARSGKVVWSNTESNRIPKANMDHGIAHDAGLTPQGYLAVVNETLVVPCGAQLPAFLNLKTGDLKTYSMGWGGRNGLPKGTWFVAGTRNYLSHGGDLYDVTRPNDERFDNPRLRPDFKSMLYPGGFTRLWIDGTNQKDLGAFQEPVFASDVLYTSDHGITAYDLSDVKVEERKRSPIPSSRRYDEYPDKWKMSSRELWRMPSELKVHIKAGEHLYLGGPGVVEAVRIPKPGEQPQVVLRTTVEGTPHRMLAAHGGLFVVTREGAIYAFSGRKKATPVTHTRPAAPSPPADAWTKTAADILQTAKSQDGYALVLGIGTGRLVEELVRQSNLDVIAIDRDAKIVDQLRQRLYQAGLYGTRASALVGDALSYPLAPYMASLVVSENWEDLHTSAGRKFVEAIFHALRPYGGTACLTIPPAQRDGLVKEASDCGFPGATVRTAADWILFCRAGPLPGSADWSHAEADAANTGASEEQFVKAPLELLWFDTPPRWFRTPGSTLVRVCGGRMFIKAERLQAIDVYTGRRLWQADLPFPHSLNDQMVALDDAIYVVGGNSCLVVDPATGRKTVRLDLPGDLVGQWLNLRVCGNHLIGQSGEHLLCMNRHSGRLEWRHLCGWADLSVACGGGKVFCAEIANRRRTGTASQTTTRALDLQTGKPLWQISGGSEVRCSPALGRVVLESGIYRAEDGGLVAAFPEPSELATKRLNKSRPVPLFLIGMKVLVGTAESYVEYDLRTGKVLGRAMKWTRRGCTTPRASANFVTTRVRGNAACIDLASREIITFWNVRAACSNNLFPADGVLNMPSLTGGCTCNYLPVSLAYVPASAIGPRQ
jgi:outer membrane protein assembly factor BamB